jgi:hypothetical protein
MKGEKARPCVFDHLLVFNNEAQALAQLQSFGLSHNDRGNWTWDLSRVNPDIKIITQEAVWDRTDPQAPELITPEEVAPGFWVMAATTDLRVGMRDLPDNKCHHIRDRDKANAGQAFMEFVSSETRDIDVDVVRISPVFAGSQYPFG